MATAPDSGGIFLSSSPTRYSSGPSEEVDELLARALKVDCLSATTISFITTHRNAFFKTFERRVNLIRSRSQAFQDSHVTVFDKVLLQLTQNGDYLDHPAAIRYFCEEFLAIPIGTSSEQEAAILSDAVIAHAPIVPAQAMTPPATHRGSVSTQGAAQACSPKKSLFGHELDSRSILLATLARDVDPAAARLWTVYDQAKQEFFVIHDPKNTKKQRTARFLRDTAENTLDYLKDKAVDPQLIEDLETNLDAAKEAVMALCGGKKRKFDYLAHRDPDERGFAAQTTQQEPIDSGRERWMYERDSRGFEETTRGDFEGHARALAHRRRFTPPRNVTQGPRHAVLELFPDERNPKRERKNQKPRPQPGRGHSNIPFGYNRAVDSYQPGL